MPKEIRVVGYDRVSSIAQVAGTSLDSQKEAITKYVKGLPDHKLVGFYTDGGVSGTTTARPALQKMIEDGKHGKFDRICFWKMTRFGRNANDTLANFELFEDRLGIGLISIEERFDTSSGYGKLIRTMLAAFAEFENSQRVEGAIAGKQFKIKQGQDASGGAIVYGYDKIATKDPTSGRTIKIEYKQNPEQAKVWKEIIYPALVLEGLSLWDVAYRLNDKGITTRRGKKWTADIRKSIRNTSLYGEHKVKLPQLKSQNKKVPQTVEKYPIHIPNPIFTKVEWDAMQNALQSRKDRGGKVKAQGTFLFRGLLKCGICGGTIICKSKPFNGSYLRYYNCKGQGLCKKYRDILGINKCTLPGLRVDYADEYIWNTILDILTDNNKIMDKVLEYSKSGKGIMELRRKIKDLEKESKKVNDKLEKIAMWELNGSYPDKIIQKQKEPLVKQQKAIVADLKKLQDSLKTKQSNVNAVDEFKGKYSDLLKDIKRNSIIINQLDSLPPETKNELVRFLYGDIQFKLYPFEKKMLGKKVTKRGVTYSYPSEQGGDTGIFVGRNQKVGVQIATSELYDLVEGEKILKALNFINNNSVMKGSLVRSNSINS